MMRSKQQFEYIRQALEEHLNAINENSSEIQSLFDYLGEMEAKMDALSSRLDAVQLEQESRATPAIHPLSTVEKRAFIVLYTAEVPLTHEDISTRAQIPLEQVPVFLDSLSRKGIPLVKSSFNKQLFVQIELGFKEKQAKENVINLSLDSFF